VTNAEGASGASPATTGVVHLAAGFDLSNALAAAVMVRSVARTLAPGARAVAHLAGFGLDADARRHIEGSGSNRLEVDWVDVDLEAGDGRPVPFTLVVDRAVPEGVERFVVLEPSTLVRRSVTELAGQDFDGCPMAAVRDLRVPTVSMPGGVAQWRALGLAPGTPYFDTGVLVVDRPGWRDEQIERRAIAHLRAHEAHDDATGQQAFNVAVAGHAHELAPRWSSQTVEDKSVAAGAAWIYSLLPAADIDAARDDPAIVHFTGARKPWYDPRTRHGGAWWEVLAETPRADWQPPARPKAARARAGLERIKRAGEALRSR
jgi:hypothetical protein